MRHVNFKRQEVKSISEFLIVKASTQNIPVFYIVTSALIDSYSTLLRIIVKYAGNME